MANPQLNKGHTRVANEILEHVMQLTLNGTQHRILLFIWRFTYGFQLKQNEFSISFIAQKINASRSQVDRELSTLIDSKIVIVTGVGEKGARILSFNKNYEEWGQPESKRKASLPLKQKEVPEQPKKTVKKRTGKVKYPDDNTYYKMAAYFHSRVTAVAKDAGIEHLIAKANLQTWSDDFRKLIEIDKVDKRLAKNVMDWVTKDDFWKTNVLSAKKLRDKFAELAIKMGAAQKPKQLVKKSDPRDKDIEFQRWIAEGNDPDDFKWNN